MTAERPIGAEPRNRRLKVLFLGTTYAGHRTRFLNLKNHTQDDLRVSPTYHVVNGWQEGGVIESLPVLPASIKGRLRAVAQSAAVASFPRPDVIWTSVTEATVPYLWAQEGPLRRPMVLDTDCTVDQLEDWADIYFHRPPKQGLGRQFARLVERALWRRISLFLPWSNWAADALRQDGISDDRIEICPPGVDLTAWQPRPELRPPESGRPRLLFVGADFDRKGGNMLLNVFSERFADTCDLHIVTRDDVAPRPHVFIHRAEPNSPTLMEQYAQADLFVLPTRAECFGIATVEAMASGLPVIVGNVGGAPDIVTDGETGWLIEPNEAALAQALTHATGNANILKAIGRKARSVAENKFDGQRNDQHILDVIVSVAERSKNKR